MTSVQALVPTRAAQFDLGNVDLRSRFRRVKRSLHWKLFGQPGLAEKIFVALLADGHLLLSGASERSKLGIYRALAEAFAGDAQLFRLQPNTTTSELTGFDYHHPEPADGIASLSAELLDWARRDVAEMKLVPSLERYAERLVLATRHPGRFGKLLEARVEAGANLETVDVLLRSARALAWLRGHRFVCAEDVQRVLGDVLRHRIHLTHAAREEGVDVDAFVRELIRCVPFL